MKRCKALHERLTILRSRLGSGLTLMVLMILSSSTTMSGSPASGFRAASNCIGEKNPSILSVGIDGAKTPIMADVRLFDLTRDKGVGKSSAIVREDACHTRMTHLPITT